MEKTKIVLPQTFEVINEIPYFRLESGEIAVENVKKVIIKSSKEDTVELITLEYKTKKIRFWRIKDKIYALSKSIFIELPEDTVFAECYFSTNYPEGCYIKYITSGKCGVMYVSETEVSSVISYNKGYTNITFENLLFYADSPKGDNKYCVIGESGKLLGTFPSKCKKLDKYMLFYDENKIFIDSSTEFEIPGGVTSVEVITKKNITFVKVVNSNGIYYYTRGIEYLLGPIVKDEIRYITEKSCYVYEKIDEKITKVYYVSYEKEKYRCESISCDSGIQVYIYHNRRTDEDDSFFATKDKLYSFLEKKKKFVPILTKIPADSYVFTIIDTFYNGSKKWGIIAVKKGKPVNVAYYEAGNDKVISSASLEYISDGWEDGFIYKSDKEIVVLDKKFEIVFSATGIKCIKKKIDIKDGWGYPEVYVVENEKEVISIYKTNGTKY